MTVLLSFFFTCFFSFLYPNNLKNWNLHPLASLKHLINNPNLVPSLVNSVDFHPQYDQFCVTYTHNNKIFIYQLSPVGSLNVLQILKNPVSQLSCPQHAVYSRDGSFLVVANWINQTFNIYQADTKGVFHAAPSAVIPFSPPLDQAYRPHGIAFSPDGRYLAVTFGASIHDRKAVGLYAFTSPETMGLDMKLIALYTDPEISRGIPKGIAFSPDGSSLVITLSETNSVAIYSIGWLNTKASLFPVQILGPSMQLSRPEDIKFNADGNYCVISNSQENTVKFYRYDRKTNQFISPMPFYVLNHSECQLNFPHGLAISSNGRYLAVTQFGSVVFNKDGYLISWSYEREDSVAIFELDAF